MAFSFAFVLQAMPVGKISSTEIEKFVFRYLHCLVKMPYRRLNMGGNVPAESDEYNIIAWLRSHQILLTAR